MPPLPEQPGLLFVAAALLPLASFALLLLAACVAAFLLRSRDADEPRGPLGGRAPAFAALATFSCSLLLALAGTTLFALDQSELRTRESAAREAETELAEPQSRQRRAELEDAVRGLAVYRVYLQRRWSGSVEWLRLYPTGVPASAAGVALRIGFRVDGVTVPLFVLVTLVALLANGFALVYLRQELAPEVEDRDVLTEYGEPLRRRGRYGWFFRSALLLCGGVLGVLLADNLLSAFVGWQLSGAAAYFLVGFSRERAGAIHAAAKAFIVGRVGDAGFLAALGILWAAFGTPSFEELAALSLPGGGNESLLTAAGLGLLAAAAARAGQVPLHVGLPDAAEAPAPASALIFSAYAPTGVYLLARCHPLLTPGVLLTAAYCGALTLFLSAGVAAVKTDVRCVLAHTAGGQLGLMTLGLATGGADAASTPPLAYVCAAALLFLGAGGVVYAARGVQDLRRTGGLLGRMPVTAWCMLAGVLVLTLTTPLVGWLAKGGGPTSAFATAAHRGHVLLLVLPLAGAALTAFALFRLWFLVFATAPRDPGVFEQAVESPPPAAPLVVLAILAAIAAWPGWPGALLGSYSPPAEPSRWYAGLAAGIALGAAALGALFAALLYVYRVWDPEAGAEFPRVQDFLMRRWYFNELYRAAVVRPVQAAAGACRWFDDNALDGAGLLLARGWRRLSRWAGRFDRKVVDGAANGVGAAVSLAGGAAAGLQTGSLRGAALWLVLAAASVFVALAYLVAAG